MTDRLYYTNAYLTSFDATVTAVRTAEGNTLVALDRSAFYPTSGGQPNDTGSLDGVAVSDVLADDGIVWHVVPGGSFAAGQGVQGSIDWARRFDHMQQHSGQHLLSQVFERHYGYETVSVHIGSGDNTLDLDAAELKPDQIEAAELLCAEKVYAALPIHAYFVDETQLAGLALRRPPKVQGTIRIVEIEDYDFSACGGTHCRSTAEVGPIKITGIEKRRGIVRVSFLCGQRAWADYRRQHALLGQIAALYSTDRAQAPALAERTQAALKDALHRIEELNGRLLGYEAAELIKEAERVGEMRVVTLLRDDLDAVQLRTLATLLIQNQGTVALLAGSAGGKLALTFARSSDGVPAELHMGNLLKAALQQAGGSGGGRPDFAQGGGIDAALAPGVLAYARAALR